MNHPEAGHEGFGLDWLERTMDPEERERMLSLPDADPASPGEIERRQSIGRLLASLPSKEAPEELWAHLRARIESLPPARKTAAARWLRRGTAAGLAAAVLLLASWLFFAYQPGLPASRVHWVIIEEDLADPSLSLEDRFGRRALCGESWIDEPASLYSRLDARGDQ